MASAATNPGPEIFAYVGALVKSCLDATHRLNGVNHVLWSGPEGYETLLNTNLQKKMRRWAGV